MKKKYCVIIILFLACLGFYMIDKQFFMKQRVLRHDLWEHIDGTRVRGDFIQSKNITFKGDTIIYTIDQDKTDTLLLIYQYFDTMKLRHLRTGKIAKYSMKGANWTNYLEF